ncbi:MAG: hypothetical protein IJH43_03290 [Mogibacterium sp.]|nr:hypothetical protein [Mogibacterium sp.]
MRNKERESLIASIDDLAATIEEKYGADVVNSQFAFYGISDLETLTVNELWEIFGTLQQMAAD